MKKIFGVMFVSFVFVSKAFASLALVDNSMVNISKVIEQQGAKYGKSNVLVVFDLDNTILTMDQEFGSNEWFDWQSNALKETDPKKKGDQEFKTFDDLLQFQTVLMTIFHMQPVEKETPSIIEQLQKDGFKVIVETSRGVDLMSATLREFKNNKLNFEISEAGDGYPESYLPITEKDKGSLTDAEIVYMRLLPARPVIYFEGVYFTSGQNKGGMLRALLDKQKLKYKAIFLIDDTKKHCDNMQAAFKDSKIDLTTVEYTAKLPIVQEFEKSNKKVMKKKFETLQHAIEAVQKP